MKNRARIGNILCAVLSIVLAGVLVFMLYTNNEKDKAQTVAIQELQEEAQPYQDELEELRNELVDLKSDLAYSSQEAKVMVGFVASAISDMNYIEEIASTYDFPPVLVIDCTMDMELIKDIIEAADDSWEIMLYASTISEESNEDILSVMTYMENEGKEYAEAFFLLSSYSTDENIQLLLNDGFSGYTSYHRDSPTVGQQEDGAIYFDYSFLSQASTLAESRAAVMYNNKASMIFAFDMASKNEGTLEDDFIVELLDTLQSYTEEDDCSFSTVGGVVEELSNINSIEADKQEDYEIRAAEIQDRMDELEDIIAEIYNKLEY